MAQWSARSHERKLSVILWITRWLISWRSPNSFTDLLMRSFCHTTVNNGLSQASSNDHVGAIWLIRSQEKEFQTKVRNVILSSGFIRELLDPCMVRVGTSHGHVPGCGLGYLKITQRLECLFGILKLLFLVYPFRLEILGRFELRTACFFELLRHQIRPRRTSRRWGSGLWSGWLWSGRLWRWTAGNNTH